MNAHPPPGPGDNFYTVCKDCGTITYTNKSSADFCQKNEAGIPCNCNANFTARNKRPCYNPTVLTCFGEQVNGDEMIAVFYKYYQVPGQWSAPIGESVLFLACRYHGPLPQGTEIVIVAGYAIRRLRDAESSRISYQFKPFTSLTKEERGVKRNTIVKGCVTIFCKTVEEHPLAEPEQKLRDSDYWLYFDELIQYMERGEDYRKLKGKQVLAKDSSSDSGQNLPDEQHLTAIDGSAVKEE